MIRNAGVELGSGASKRFALGPFPRGTFVRGVIFSVGPSVNSAHPVATDPMPSASLAIATSTGFDPAMTVGQFRSLDQLIRFTDAASLDASGAPVVGCGSSGSMFVALGLTFASDTMLIFNVTAATSFPILCSVSIDCDARFER